MQNYTVSVTGGTAETSYFLSGEVGSNEGVLPNDLLEKVSVRGNFRFVPRSDLILDFNTGYTRRQLELTPQGHTGQGIGGIQPDAPGGARSATTGRETCSSFSTGRSRTTRPISSRG